MRPTNASGRGLDSRWRVLFAAISVALATVAGALADAERTFFLALDSVPYATVAALQASGSAPELFAEMGPPVPLISTFPSTTTVALGAALRPLGLEISPGYEARFFDWQRRSIRGGGPISFFRIDFPWRDFFAWSRKGIARSAFASLRPVAASEGRALDAFAAFLASDRSDFFAYVETTDTAAHLRGPASLGNMFRRLGEAIRSARLAGEEFRVVLFSDHGIAGGEPLENVLPLVHESLENAGFVRRKRLRSAHDVVLTPYGLVSSFEAYAREEVVSDLAAALVSTPGVELCAYREAEAVWLVGNGGSAAIARQGGLWAYLPKTGDPLGYRRVSQELEIERTDPGPEGWFTDRDWFEATKGVPYPDALRRIVSGFELVSNPASVVCSLEGGYMYGPRRTERAARWTGGRLRWTHGALSWEASAGFLATDICGAGSSGALRLAEALAPLVTTARGRSSRVRGAARPWGAGEDREPSEAPEPGGREALSAKASAVDMM